MASPAHPRDDDGSAARPLQSQVQDVASVARERLGSVVAALQTPAVRHGLRDGWDSLVRVMFAPCVGDVGGVPREDLGGRAPDPGVPFEVTASTSREEGSSPGLVARRFQRPAPPAAASPAARPPTALEQRTARSRARLRQLGAQHQLASGLPGGGLADVARPVSPREEVEALQPPTPDMVDFDDGISAISAHTLEEMVRRSRGCGPGPQPHVVRLDPRDFAPTAAASPAVAHEGAEIVLQATEESTEASFRATPPRGDDDPALLRNVRTASGPAREEYLQFSPAAPPAADPGPVAAMARRQRSLNTTLNTTATEDSHEFEEMRERQEALYWRDAERVARAEGGARHCTGSGPSIEERARRLRELSRSRSRSDGTGSSHKSSSSLLQPHPHDTFPRHKLAGRGRSRRSPQQRQDSFVPGSRLAPTSPEYGEI